MANPPIEFPKEGFTYSVELVLSKFWDLCDDGDGVSREDKFKIIAGRFWMHTVRDTDVTEETLKRFNRKVREFLGSGHSGGSCLQFWRGKAGRAALRVVHRDFPGFISEEALEKVVAPPAWEDDPGSISQVEPF